MHRREAAEIRPFEPLEESRRPRAAGNVQIQIKGYRREDHQLRLIGGGQRNRECCGEHLIGRRAVDVSDLGERS